VFRIGGNTFYNQKNKIPMKIPEFKRSGIGLNAEFRRIPNGIPNQGPLAFEHAIQMQCMVQAESYPERLDLLRECVNNERR
jgi:hypothetical protein